MIARKSEQFLPLPRTSVPISIRVATLADLPFIDQLQKTHSKQVGWMPTKQLEGKIGLGHVIVAEQGQGASGQGQGNSESSLAPRPLLLAPVPVGYCIGHDQYFKRDDLGIIYQLNVAPGKQRGLIGASLIKAMFEKAAYGCRLFCCWCAQDIAANRFWESIGFVPLAFRAGSRGKQRVHIFWQRRIRSGDTTTPYWFPSQTTSGSIREDRLVLPIPPGTHWSDAKPMILPGEESSNSQVPSSKQISNSKSRKKAQPVQKRNAVRRNGIWFDIPKQVEPIALEKPKREPRAKVKNDPKLVAAARELRDRWLEQVNSGQYLPEAAGKYEVCRELDGAAAKITPLLEAAIAA